MISYIRNYQKLKKFRKKWRTHNINNNTVAINVFDIDKVKVGKATYGPIQVESWGHPDELLQIGNFCSIASGVKFILGGNHSVESLALFSFKYFCEGKLDPGLTKGPILVEDDVWIGTDALILSGVKIGRGSVIGARSVVANNIPPFSVAVGNPCRVLKRRFSESILNGLEDVDLDLILNCEVYTKYPQLFERPLTEETLLKIKYMALELKSHNPNARLNLRKF